MNMNATDLTQLRGNWSYPTSVRFGIGRIRELPEACKAAGMQKPLLVTDPGLAQRPMVKRTLAINAEAGIPTGLFSNIQPDPIGPNVRDGVAAFQAGDHDGVIALGGGSALDTGKVIALLARQEQDIWEMEGAWGNIPHPEIAPVVTVPTTAGTGSEVGRAAVITHETENVKKILLHPGMMPKQVVADPELTLSLPPHLTAATGMDALAHNLEALCAPFYHPMADGIAVEGIRLIHEWLPTAYQEGHNLEARVQMMIAAMMGATAFQKGLGAIHALSHPIGAMYHIHHGLTNAIVMPYVLTFNRPAIEPAMTRLARYLDLPNPGFDAVHTWILDLRKTLHIPHTLREVGVDETYLDELAESAAADPNAPENPVAVDASSLRRLYEDALGAA